MYALIPPIAPPTTAPTAAPIPAAIRFRNRPVGSVWLTGSLPTYRYRLASPPEYVIGSWLIHTPLRGSYHRDRLYCSPDSWSVSRPVYPYRSNSGTSSDGSQ